MDKLFEILEQLGKIGSRIYLENHWNLYKEDLARGNTLMAKYNQGLLIGYIMSLSNSNTIPTDIITSAADDIFNINITDESEEV